MSIVSSYHAPVALTDVLRLLSASGDGAPPKPLAGGSDLIVQMGAGRHRPSSIIDLKCVPEMTGITRHDGGWRIAAATSCAVMGEHAELRSEWPGVVEAANLIGSKQVQGRATVAGNLCNASPGADSVPALIAAGAVVEIGSIGADGAVKIRELPVEAVPQGPGRTNLAPGELVLAVRLPKRAARASDAYLRLIPRTEMDIAVVGCGVSLELDADGRIVAARVALGAVAPTALLVPAAAEALIGSKLDADALAKVAAAASAACKPIDDKRGTVAYRIQVAGVLARRAATQAYQRALQRSTQETRA
jgi:CO/xanthine dehydrogenase FAD-binding subunit